MTTILARPQCVKISRGIRGAYSADKYIPGHIHTILAFCCVCCGEVKGPISIAVALYEKIVAVSLLEFT